MNIFGAGEDGDNDGDEDTPRKDEDATGVEVPATEDTDRRRASRRDHERPRGVAISIFPGDRPPVRPGSRRPPPAEAEGVEDAFFSNMAWERSPQKHGARTAVSAKGLVREEGATGGQKIRSQNQAHKQAAYRSCCAVQHYARGERRNCHL